MTVKLPINLKIIDNAILTLYSKLISFPINQTKYLINGEFLEWDGPIEEVFLPIYFKENELTKNVIGSYPLMVKKTSIMALEAANLPIIVVKVSCHQCH